MNSQFGEDEMVNDASKGLGKNISKLMFCGDMTETDQPFHELMPDKMTI